MIKKYYIHHCETHLKSKLELATANAILGDKGNITSKLNTSSPDFASSIAYFFSFSASTKIMFFTEL